MIEMVGWSFKLRRSSLGTYQARIEAAISRCHVLEVDCEKNVPKPRRVSRESVALVGPRHFKKSISSLLYCPAGLNIDDLRASHRRRADIRRYVPRSFRPCDPWPQSIPQTIVPRCFARPTARLRMIIFEFITSRSVIALLRDKIVVENFPRSNR
jgi:hypothetical protein